MKEIFLNEFLNYLYEKEIVKQKEGEQQKIEDKGNEMISKIPEPVKKQIVLASDDVPPILYKILRNRAAKAAAEEAL